MAVAVSSRKKSSQYNRKKKNRTKRIPTNPTIPTIPPIARIPRIPRIVSIQAQRQVVLLVVLWCCSLPNYCHCFFLQSHSQGLNGPKGLKGQGQALLSQSQGQGQALATMTFISKSSTLSTSTSLSMSTSSATAVEDIQKLAQEMNDRAKNNVPFTEEELHELQISFSSIFKEANEKPTEANEATEASDEKMNVDMDTDCDKMWNELRQLFVDVGHLSHKDWDRTGNSASKLCDILLPNHDNADTDGNKDGDGLTQEFKSMFHRVIKEGNWDNAILHTKEQKQHVNDNANHKPWAVLVTGVNGIRKTTSVYQSWFPQLLEQALIEPKADAKADANKKAQLVLPTGHNSFFRQLDHMIATIANYNFQILYQLTSQSHDFASSSSSSSTSSSTSQPSKKAKITSSSSSSSSSSSPPPKNIIQNYSDYKASIFTRYRTLSEILGVMLVRRAKLNNINVMIETSGRDVAMYHYVDTFFPSEEYNKLVLHFTINDLVHAESSVDGRMVVEMEGGVRVLSSSSSSTTSSSSSTLTSTSNGVNVKDLINVNAGGPYGSEVLVGIQKDSDAVWETIVKGGKEGNNNDNGNDDNNGNDNDDDDKGVGHDWYKASIKIEAHADKDWTARAVLPDGTDGEVYIFEAPRKV